MSAPIWGYATARVLSFCTRRGTPKGSPRPLVAPISYSSLRVEAGLKNAGDASAFRIVEPKPRCRRRRTHAGSRRAWSTGNPPFLASRRNRAIQAVPPGDGPSLLGVCESSAGLTTPRGTRRGRGGAETHGRLWTLSSGTGRSGSRAVSAVAPTDRGDRPIQAVPLGGMDIPFGGMSEHACPFPPRPWTPKGADGALLASGREDPFTYIEGAKDLRTADLDVLEGVNQAPEQPTRPGVWSEALEYRPEREAGVASFRSGGPRLDDGVDADDARPATGRAGSPIRAATNGSVTPKNGAKRIRTADLLDSAVKAATAALTASWRGLRSGRPLDPGALPTEL